MTFGDVLRELLEEREISQKQLAADLNMAATTIGNYVRGIREPDFAVLKLFADYFHVTTDYLLNFQSGKTKNHDEDKLLYLYRSLPTGEKDLLIEQGKLLERHRLKEIAKSSKSTSQNDDNAE